MTSDEKKIMVKFSAPIREGDSEDQTFGCRHSNPDICKNMYVSGICAFANDDKICKKPSAAWKKQYLRLSQGE